MTSETICLTAGIIFMFIAIIGGGFRLKDTEIPPLPPKVRGVLAVLGLLLVLPLVVSLVFTGVQTMNPIPKGTIMAWNGNPKTPPKGWAICDTAGHKENPEVPDLTGKFLKALEAGEEIGATGGSVTHQHNEVFHIGYEGKGHVRPNRLLKNPPISRSSNFS